MNRTFITYGLTALLFISLLSPTIESIVSSIYEDHHTAISLELADSEKEENSDKGEESKDAKEKEKFEDEKLKSKNDKFGLFYLNNTIKAKNSGLTNNYHNVVGSVLTPPPEA